ncbi:MAG: dephospho-CoA kinase [Oscillospiraceae bacterium]|nr:dephospho-CoA kinase [Oscillospiraceae bacterium]
MKKTVVAITGQSGSGKSNIGRYYAEKGYTVIDCDLVARQIHTDKECMTQLCEYFGYDILTDGLIDRAKLGKKAFADADSLQKLTDITHPFIIKNILETIDKSDSDIVFVDGAVIIGHEFEKYCDRFIVVICDRSKQYERLMKRDGITLEQAQNRIAKQTKREILLGKANYIIYNNETEKNMYNQAEYILRALKAEQ